MTELSKNSNAWTLIFIAWLVSCLAMSGSLFFSEVMGYPPCSLCWYQRIMMYPLVIILLIGQSPISKQTFKFAFPFALIGWLISVYHNLLQIGIIPKSASPCREGLSCSDVWINWLGFITIPVLSFGAFSLILTLLIIFYRRHYK